MVNLTVMFNNTEVAFANRDTDVDGRLLNFTVPGAHGRPCASPLHVQPAQATQRRAHRSCR